MARDYGQRRTARRRSNGIHQFLVILVTFILGYVSAFFLDLEKLTHFINTQALGEPVQRHEVARATKQAAQLPPKPKFEFYTLLANEKVPSQGGSGSSHATAAKAPAPSTNATNTLVSAAVKSGATTPQRSAEVKVAESKQLVHTAARKGSFLVQVASFKIRKDAEHMKGLLTLKGFDVAVVPVTQARGNWFRVVVGPYSSRQQAIQAQYTLAKTERLNGMVTSVGG
ncbi:MAG: SPOR domain-containing protein [Legionellales bacterium]